MRFDAVLFDLDNTLLTNSMSSFVPRYFSLLSEYAATRFADRQAFLAELMAGTQAMMTREAGPWTNREVFWRLFEERTGQSAAELEPFFDQFYENEFRELRHACEERPVALQFVRACFDLGLRVVIATNPLFPRRAVEHRLAWAGLPVDSFDFSLVTTYDNMHASKPNRAYYEEILETVGVPAQRAVMFGDDWENDIVPAAASGLTTYWVHEDDEQPPDAELIAGDGSLEDAYRWFLNVTEAGH